MAGLANAIVGSHPANRRRHRHRHADRADGRDVPRPSIHAGSALGNAVRFVSGRAAVRAVDPDRPIHLHCWSCCPPAAISGIAGCIALAVIVIPIVVRTTEDMLRLMPDLAAGGGGGPWRPESGKSIVFICYPAAGGRDHDRRAAGHCPHRRRNGAAAVHQPRQPQRDGQISSTRQRWSPRSARRCPAYPSPSTNTPGRPTRTWWTCPGSLHCLITFGVLALNIIAPFGAEPAQIERGETRTRSMIMSENSTMASSSRQHSATVERGAEHRSPAHLDPQPGFLLRHQQGAQGHPCRSNCRRSKVNRHDRSVRLCGKSTLLRVLEPHVRPVSRAARRG